MAHGMTETDHLMTADGQPAWHNFNTTILDQLATAQEALEVAKMGWIVQKEPVLAASGKPLEGKFLLTRSDTQTPLAVVGSAYKPVQQAEAFQFFDAVTQDPHGAKYVTAGSLFGGRKVFMLAKLPSFIEVVKGDIIEEYILLTNSHDGENRAKMFWTPIRAVCNNTVSMAEAGAKDISTFKFKHLGPIMDKVGRAQEVIGIAKQNSIVMAEAFEVMRRHEPTQKQIDKIVAHLFPSYSDTPQKGKPTAQSERIHNEVKALAENGRGNDLPGVKGTTYALYNGITEYVDYYKQSKARVTSREDSRLDSIWFGEGRKTKIEAFDLCLQLASKK